MKEIKIAAKRAKTKIARQGKRKTEIKKHKGRKGQGKGIKSQLMGKNVNKCKLKSKIREMRRKK